MHRFYSIAVLAAVFLFTPALSFAGTFRATPLNLFIDSKSKTETLRVTNEGDEKVTVQIDAKAWSQDETGHDIYSETADIVVFPKITTIEKGETRIIRVGYGGTSTMHEQTYRVFVQELPVSKPGEAALRFALTLSLPVFVAPNQEIVDWSVELGSLAQESLQIKVKNGGNDHLMINKIKATGLDTSGAEVFTQETAGWYTLAGKSRMFSVSVPYQDCQKATRINVEVQAKESSKNLNMEVNKAMCTRKPAAGNRTAKTPAQDAAKSQ